MMPTKVAGFIPVSSELMEDARIFREALAEAHKDWMLTLEIGPKHGPWLHQSMPDHLWPDNTWWWLPEEDEREDDWDD